MAPLLQEPLFSYIGFFVFVNQVIDILNPTCVTLI